MARILIAEDDDSVREFVVRALTLSGHDTTTVPDGLRALEALSGEVFDLLLTDIVMPGLDGIALALKAGSAYPHMRIVMMSGYSAERQRAHNLDALVHRVIAKPFSLRQLSEVIDATLAA
jgi:two-component system, cell cycle response regulator CpdR